MVDTHAVGATPIGGPTTLADRLAASRARPAVDLRSLLDPTIGSQGIRPLCVAFSLAAGNEAARTAGGQQPDPLAPESIWWCCTRRKQTGARGVLLRDGGMALSDVGQPLIAVWPYKEQLGVGTEDPPASAGSPPWNLGTLCDLNLAHDGVEDALEDTLAVGIPVVLVVEVTNEFAEPDESGHVATPSVQAPLGDFHAVVCVGAATDPSLGRRLLIRNSWGDSWGLGGYCWLPLDYLIAFVAQAAYVRLASPGNVGQGATDEHGTNSG